MSWAFWQECPAPETTLEPGSWGQSSNGLRVCAVAQGESGCLAPEPAKPSRQYHWAYWAFSSTSDETSLAAFQRNTSYIKYVEHTFPPKCVIQKTHGSEWSHLQLTEGVVFEIGSHEGTAKGREKLRILSWGPVLFFCQILKYLGHRKIKP